MKGVSGWAGNLKIVKQFKQKGFISFNAVIKEVSERMFVYLGIP